MNACILVFQSPDGKYIACGTIDGIVSIFDTTTGHLLHALEGKQRFSIFKPFVYVMCNCAFPYKVISVDTSLFL